MLPTAVRVQSWNTAAIHSVVSVCVCDDGRLRQSEHASLIFLDGSGDLANETKLKGAGA